MEFNRVNPWLKRLARASAWGLLIGVMVLIFSGWGITQTGIIYSLTGGLIDRRLADAIHRTANVPLAFFFLSHVLINIKLMLSPSTLFREWLASIILIALGVLLMAMTVYMEYFRPGG